MQFLRVYTSIFTVTLIAASALTSLAQSAKPAPVSDMFDAAQLLRDVQMLSSDEMAGRSPEQPAIQKARDFVEKRFADVGLKPLGGSFAQEFAIRQANATEPLKGINFVGQIKGGKHPDKYIIITAHYDHEGLKNGEIFNGADDNASGTAALFSIASYFARNRPDHSLIFVAFDAEEMGLLGARHFVTNLPVKKEAILLNINMDMISRSDKGELYAAGTFQNPHLRPKLEAVQKKAKIKLLLGHDDPKTGRDNWVNQSDQAAFHAAGISFIYFGVEDHKDYHRPTDDFANIQPEFYVRAVETVAAAIVGFDKEN